MACAAWLHVAALALSAAIVAARSPVVVVPGTGSNLLEARLNKPSTVSWKCDKTSDWFTLWLEIAHLVVAPECWADNIRLVLDEVTGESRNNDGVETRVPGWGDTASIDCLEPSLCSATAAFKSMTDALVEAGYVRNSTLLGAPYDFRYAPFSKVGHAFQADLKQMIESAVARTGERAVVVSHSMGGLQTLHFMTQQTQAWKDAHIREWVAISAPWGGANKEVRDMASGENQGLPVDPLKARVAQRSFETNLWLLPGRWHDGTPIVTTPSRNYTTQDYPSFFRDIGYESGLKIYEQVAKLPNNALPSPGVKMRCLYSTGVDTPSSFHYPDGLEASPVIQNGDGDGTVTFQSLKLCERWAADGSSKPFSSKLFHGLSHLDMIKDPQVIAEVMCAAQSDGSSLTDTTVLV